MAAATLTASSRLGIDSSTSTSRMSATVDLAADAACEQPDRRADGQPDDGGDTTPMSRRLAGRRRRAG
jgi:hypothetical protein